jgi:AcrR family transcriptional regulator
MSRTGRRPGETRTKDAIVTAARRQFGAHGFAGTSIRSIAAEAEVDPALVMQFFGSKDSLFTATVEWPFDPAERVPALVAGARAGAGARVVALFVETWDAEGGHNPIVALLRAAAEREPAERHLREFLQRDLLGPILAGLGSDQPDLRASLVAAHLTGLGVARYVLRFEPLASLPPAAVVDLMAPSVQAALTGRL